MKKIHLIMPMGGKGLRFSGHGYESPKPLIEIKGKPFFYWSTQSIKKFMDIKDLTYVVLQEHVDNYAIDKRILEFYPEAIIHIIPEVLNGAVLTCMEGLKEINDNEPVIFNDCDHIFRCKRFEDFIEKQFDREIAGALLTFLSNSPKYSFLRLDDHENVIETVEKEVVSNHAICGCYYFSDRNTFLDALQTYLKECNYKEFFVSGLYNVMARSGKLVKQYPTDFHVSFGVPEEYEEAKLSHYFDELI